MRGSAPPSAAAADRRDGRGAPPADLPCSRPPCSDRDGWKVVTLTVTDNDGGTAEAQAELCVCSPGGDASTITTPGRIRLEVEACIALNGDTVPGLLPMGLAPADASGVPGLLWVLAAGLALWQRREPGG